MPRKSAPKKSAPKKPARKKTTKGNKPLTREAMLQQLAPLLEDEGIVTADDLRALMTSMNGPSVGDGMSHEDVDARYAAQELALDAMEARTEAEARKLAKRALRLDPDCVDALLVMTDLDARNPRQLIEGLQKAVAAGERSLGRNFIEENTGHFWMLLDTRPYMRALQVLGDALRGEGINLDAIKVFERMLELNPNDNQGVRDPLLGLYLQTGDLKGAGRLLKKYKDDASANFAWGRVLERFLAGDEKGAMAALKAARKANRHLELFLTARKSLPEDLPEMYSPGSEEEAVLCLGSLGAAWVQHEEACSWFFDQLIAEEQQGVVSQEALLRAPVAGKKVQ